MGVDEWVGAIAVGTMGRRSVESELAGEALSAEESEAALCRHRLSISLGGKCEC